jgi:hypothetical protein
MIGNLSDFIVNFSMLKCFNIILIAQFIIFDAPQLFL